MQAVSRYRVWSTADGDERAGAPPAADKGAAAAPERDVFLPRVPFNRSATYVFDKTVAPEEDIADVSHEKVSDMLEDVFAAKALFRGRCAWPRNFL